MLSQRRMCGIRELFVATVTALAVAAAFILSERVPPSAQPWPDELLRTQLDRRMDGDVAFSGSFEGALRMLIGAGVPLKVHWEQVLEYSTSRPGATQVSLRLRDAKVEQWLTAIEFQISEGLVFHWVDATGAIHVTNRFSQQPPRVSQLYDVRDIVED